MAQGLHRIAHYRNILSGNYHISIVTSGFRRFGGPPLATGQLRSWAADICTNRIYSMAWGGLVGNWAACDRGWPQAHAPHSADPKGPRPPPAVRAPFPRS